MSAPNDFGSNLAKAQPALLIDETGQPISPTNPSQVEVIYNGAPVSASNPLPAVAITP
jgi:hypothetical protein